MEGGAAGRGAGALLGLLLLGAPQVGAQQPGEGAPPDAYATLSEAERRPQLDSAGRAWVQRLLLRNGGTWNGFQGSLRLAFTVDTAGRVRRSTLRVLHADTGRFAQRYARTLASELRYSPAMQDGAAVAVELEQGFEYRHPGDRGGDITVAPLRLQVRETEEARGSTIRLEWAPVAATPLPGLETTSAANGSWMHSRWCSRIPAGRRRLSRASRCSRVISQCVRLRTRSNDCARCGSTWPAPVSARRRTIPGGRSGTKMAPRVCAPPAPGLIPTSSP
jgi:hypothetical protein